MDVTELNILGALAETLIPADDTPGADPEWAKSFVQRRVRDHPDERVRFQRLVSHLEALALAEHGTGFAQISIPMREALLGVHHPTLIEGAELASEERELRRTMRDMIAGFLSADGFDLDADPYCLRPGTARRDRELSSSPDYSTADYLPDVVIQRQLATWVGTGTYARVWLAAGYPYPPGVPPQDPEDVARAPDELVKLRSSKPR